MGQGPRGKKALLRDRSNSSRPESGVLERLGEKLFSSMAEFDIVS